MPKSAETKGKLCIAADLTVGSLEKKLFMPKITLSRVILEYIKFLGQKCHKIIRGIEMLWGPRFICSKMPKGINIKGKLSIIMLRMVDAFFFLRRKSVQNTKDSEFLDFLYFGLISVGEQNILTASTIRSIWIMFP